MRPFTPSSLAVAAILAMAATAAETALAQDGEGPSTLRETYQDWTVNCARGEAGRTCAMSQQQRHRESGQLALAVELAAGEGEALAGNIVLPFGLRLAQGVVLQDDDQSAWLAASFSTCLPVGCLVPLAFEADAVARLRPATMMNLEATANDDGAKVAFSVSLKGFSAAHDRLKALREP